MSAAVMEASLQGTDALLGEDRPRIPRSAPLRTAERKLRGRADELEAVNALLSGERRELPSPAEIGKPLEVADGGETLGFLR